MLQKQHEKNCGETQRRSDGKVALLGKVSDGIWESMNESCKREERSNRAEGRGRREEGRGEESQNIVMRPVDRAD